MPIAYQKDPAILRLARQEKDAISFVDSFINSQSNRNSVQFPALQNHLNNAKNEIRSRIGENSGEIKKFIVARNYLWTYRRDENTVAKTPQNTRRALFHLLEYAQKRCYEKPWGAQLKDLSSVLGESYPDVKSALGRGLNALKAFLLEYPSLFLTDPFEEVDEIGDTIFINRAFAMEDGTILLSKEDGISFESPVYLRSIGRVTKMTSHYGFVKDEATSEDAYFSESSFPGVVGNNLINMVKKNEKYVFEAVISPRYEDGDAHNKWSILRMVTLANYDKFGFEANSPVENPVRENAVSASGDFDVQVGMASGSQAEASNLKSQIGAANSVLRSKNETPEVASGAAKESVAKKTNQDGRPKAKNENIEATWSTQHGASSQTSPVVLETARSRISGAVAQSQPKADQIKITRSVACQAEFNDDRELLLRLLRNSPGLLKLVRVMQDGQSLD